MLQTLPLPTAKCYMFHWEKDNFGKLVAFGIRLYFPSVLFVFIHGWRWCLQMS